MTPVTIPPTIGCVVWFHPSESTGEAGFSRHGNDKPYAAIVAHVHSDRLVNLTVFDANGVPHSRTSVELVQDGDTIPGHGYYCEWMPHQKGQAAKAEAAEKIHTVEPAFRQRTQREELEYALMVGAAARVAELPESATSIANGIKAVLNALHPTRAQIDAATITLPVVDPGQDSLEREIQAKADKAPRVTPQALLDEIVSEHYHSPQQAGGQAWTGGANGALNTPTFCVLVLRNGLTVVGHSACASPENFNAEIGRRIARENAERQIWPLLGFRLRDELARPVLTDGDVAADLAGTCRPDNHTSNCTACKRAD